MTLKRKIEFIIRNNLLQEGEDQIEKLTKIVATNFLHWSSPKLGCTISKEDCEKMLETFLEETS